MKKKELCIKLVIHKDCEPLEITRLRWPVRHVVRCAYIGNIHLRQRRSIQHYLKGSTCYPDSRQTFFFTSLFLAVSARAGPSLSSPTISRKLHKSFRFGFFVCWAHSFVILLLFLLSYYFFTFFFFFSFMFVFCIELYMYIILQVCPRPVMQRTL